MGRLAFFGDNKQINIWHSENRELTQLTYPLFDGERAPCLWPTWSKDGEWIAYFQPLQPEAPARLCIAQVDGLDMAVLAEFHDRQPIYMHWSPTGTHLAVVEQSPEGLELVVYPINGSGSIPIDDGAPIFFQWLSDGTGLIAHVVHPIRQTSRVQFYSLEDSNTDWVISEDSGGFCAPVFWNEKLLFAEQLSGKTHLMAFCLKTEEKDTLCVLDGVLSIQPRPNHSQVAIGMSGAQLGTQRGIRLLDTVTGQLDIITEQKDERLAWQSMFWTPDGSKLLMSAGNRSQRWLEWQFWDDDGEHIINQFIPTQEQFFFLHFFEQFAHSHQIISTDSTHFYFSGYEAPNQRVDMPARPWIFKGTLEEGADFEAVEHGLFPTVQPRTVT